MKRKIIKIDENKCNGCGLCADACHEGAIKIIDGKARLIRDDYCDGLGDCLPVCPTEAISFEEREAAAYDKEAVEKNMKQQNKEKLPCGCPGTHSKRINRNEHENKVNIKQNDKDNFMNSYLSQWPVQIKLVPTNAPYFDNANLLIAADCTAFAYGNFHSEFIKNHVTLIGCPKLDNNDYSEKLTEIIKNNNIKSVKIVRMEVPCCQGIENAVITALKNSGKMIPWQVNIISVDGRIIG